MKSLDYLKESDGGLDPSSASQGLESDKSTCQTLFVGKGGVSEEEAVRILARVLKIGLAFKNRELFYSPSDGFSPSSIVDQPLPTEGKPIESLLEDLEENYLPGMPNFASPCFLGFPDAGNSLAGICGAILADFLNVNLINSTFCSRIATDVEICILRWLRQLLGYPDAGAPKSAIEVGGMALLGGTMSNYTATLLAREHAFPGTSERGIRFNTDQVKVVVPEGIGHYTIPASMAWAGLGSENILQCPTDNFRYDQKALKGILYKANNSGDRIIMLVAYAGDSRTMTIDDLQGVHDIVREADPKVWLHCDGCHGTALCFSDRLRHKLRGLQLWDSITLDPHKVLAVPYPLAVLLLRDPRSASLVITKSDLIMRQQQSLGQTTPVLGSKAFHSLRLWMLLRSLGVPRIGKLVEERCGLALRFAEMVRSHPCFVVLNHLNINSVIFMYLPKDVKRPLARDTAERISLLNRSIYEHMLRQGRYYIHSFRMRDNLNLLEQGCQFEANVLRYMCGNPLTTETILNECLDYLATLGDGLWSNEASVLNPLP